MDYDPSVLDNHIGTPFGIGSEKMTRPELMGSCSKGISENRDILVAYFQRLKETFPLAAARAIKKNAEQARSVFKRYGISDEGLLGSFISMNFDRIIANLYASPFVSYVDVGRLPHPNQMDAALELVVRAIINPRKMKLVATVTQAGKTGVVTAALIFLPIICRALGMPIFSPVVLVNDDNEIQKQTEKDVIACYDAFTQVAPESIDENHPLVRLVHARDGQNGEFFSVAEFYARLGYTARSINELVQKRTSKNIGLVARMYQRDPGTIPFVLDDETHHGAAGSDDKNMRKKCIGADHRDSLLGPDEPGLFVAVTASPHGMTNRDNVELVPLMVAERYVGFRMVDGIDVSNGNPTIMPKIEAPLDVERIRKIIGDYEVANAAKRPFLGRWIAREMAALYRRYNPKMGAIVRLCRRNSEAEQLSTYLSKDFHVVPYFSKSLRTLDETVAEAKLVSNGKPILVIVTGKARCSYRVKSVDLFVDFTTESYDIFSLAQGFAGRVNGIWPEGIIPTLLMCKDNYDFFMEYMASDGKNPEGRKAPRGTIKCGDREPDAFKILRVGKNAPDGLQSDDPKLDRLQELGQRLVNARVGGKGVSARLPQRRERDNDKHLSAADWEILFEAAKHVAATYYGDYEDMRILEPSGKCEGGLFYDMNDFGIRIEFGDRTFELMNNDDDRSGGNGLIRERRGAATDRTLTGRGHYQIQVNVIKRDVKTKKMIPNKVIDEFGNKVKTNREVRGFYEFGYFCVALAAKATRRRSDDEEIIVASNHIADIILSDAERARRDVAVAMKSRRSRRCAA